MHLNFMWFKQGIGILITNVSLRKVTSDLLRPE